MQIQMQGSMIERSSRVINWYKTTPTSVNIRLDRFDEKVEVWTGRVNPKVDDVTMYDVGDTNLYLIHGHHKAKLGSHDFCQAFIQRMPRRGLGEIISGDQFVIQHLGSKESKQLAMEKAVEDIYHKLFKAMTETKFRDACNLELHKNVVLLGKWMNKDDYQTTEKRKLWTIVKAEEDQVFVIGCNEKEKLIIGIQKILSNPPGSPFAAAFTVIGGGLVQQSLDWHIHRPEQYMKGEQYCKYCKSVYGNAFGMIAVHGFGMLCGPCLDDAMGRGLGVDDTMYDLV